MISVELDNTDWQQVLAILWNASGPGISCGTTHALVMKIGEQLRQHQQGNSQQMPAAQEQLKPSH